MANERYYLILFQSSQCAIVCGCESVCVCQENKNIRWKNLIKRPISFYEYTAAKCYPNHLFGFITISFVSVIQRLLLFLLLLFVCLRLFKVFFPLISAGDAWTHTNLFLFLSPILSFSLLFPRCKQIQVQCTMKKSQCLQKETCSVLHEKFFLHGHLISQYGTATELHPVSQNGAPVRCTYII